MSGIVLRRRSGLHSSHGLTSWGQTLSLELGDGLSNVLWDVLSDGRGSCSKSDNGSGLEEHDEVQMSVGW